MGKGKGKAVEKSVSNTLKQQDDLDSDKGKAVKKKSGEEKLNITSRRPLIVNHQPM